MVKVPLLAALMSSMLVASCGKGDKTYSKDIGDPPAGMDRLRTEKVALVMTKHHAHATLLVVAEVTARQHGLYDIVNGSDSAKVVLYLSTGSVLESPAIGSPRYRPGCDDHSAGRLAVWRWAWHSMADSCLELADSSCNIDSARALARWSDASGRHHQISAFGTNVDVSRNVRRMD